MYGAITKSVQDPHDIGESQQHIGISSEINNRVSLWVPLLIFASIASVFATIGGTFSGNAGTNKNLQSLLNKNEESLELNQDDAYTFTIWSPSFTEAGSLNINYTCIALGVPTGGKSPPLAWSNSPKGTAQYLVFMKSNYYDESNGNELKYDWILYDIPSSTTSLPENVSNETGYCDSAYGLCGGTTPEKPEYYYKAPCSDGYGTRNYTFEVYALSAPIVNYFNYTLVEVDLHDWSPTKDTKEINDDGSAYCYLKYSNATTFPYVPLLYDYPHHNF